MAVMSAISVGDVIEELYGLELALRQFLHNLDASPTTSEPLPSISIGDVVLSDALTNADGLGALIEKFNRAAAINGHQELAVDPTLEDLSDVLTHSRIWATDAQPPLRLVTFSRPVNGMVTCTFDELMDDWWLTAERSRVQDAIASVSQARQEVHPKHWAPGT